MDVRSRSEKHSKNIRLESQSIKPLFVFSLFNSLPFILSGSDEISLMVYAA